MKSIRHILENILDIMADMSDKRIAETLINKERCRPGYIEEGKQTCSLSNAEFRVLQAGLVDERKIAAENLKYKYNPREFPSLASSMKQITYKEDMDASLRKNKKVMNEKNEKDQTAPVKRDQETVKNSMAKITTQNPDASLWVHLKRMDETRKKDQMDIVEEAVNTSIELQSSVTGSSIESDSESEVEELDPAKTDKKKSPIENELLPLYDTIQDVLDGSKIAMDQKDLIKKILLKATKVCYKYEIAFARLQGNYEVVLKSIKTYEKKLERERETKENYREKYIDLIEETCKDRHRKQEEEEKIRHHELEKIEKLKRTYNEFITEVTHINKMYSQQEPIPSSGPPRRNTEQLKDTVIIEEEGKQPSYISRTMVTPNDVILTENKRKVLNMKTREVASKQYTVMKEDANVKKKVKLE